MIARNTRQPIDKNKCYNGAGRALMMKNKKINKVIFG